VKKSLDASTVSSIFILNCKTLLDPVRVVDGLSRLGGGHHGIKNFATPPSDPCLLASHRMDAKQSTETPVDGRYLYENVSRLLERETTREGVMDKGDFAFGFGMATPYLCCSYRWGSCGG